MKLSKILLRKVKFSKSKYKIILFWIVLSLVVYILYQRKLLSKFQEEKTLEKFTEVFESKSVEFEPLYQERRDVQFKTCQNENKDFSTNFTSFEYVVSHEHKIIWCPIFKSGTSSWYYILNKAKGFSEDDMKGKILMNLARTVYQRPSKSELRKALKDEYTSFVVGRNPFERLVSGYRQKILGALRGTLHDKMSKIILSKYRGLKESQFKFGVTKPTFREFIRYILDERRSGKGMDMHWTPASEFCNLCQMNFTYIQKFETFDQDTKVILKKTGLLNLFKKDKLSQNQSKGGRTTNFQTNKYISELYPNELQEISDLYKLDFDIFGYKIPTYEELHPIESKTL